MSNTYHHPLEGQRVDLVLDLNQQIADEMVSIVIVHKDDPARLNICLQSIAVTSVNNNYEIILVDNASTKKDAVDFLDDLEATNEVKVVRNKTNAWWSAAANAGVRAARKESKYIIFLHPDVVILNPSWMDLLINVSEGQDSGMVGVSMHSYWLDKQKVDFIEEWCLLLTRECWNDCGPFPEELPLIGSAFALTMAAQTADHRPQVIRNTLVHHYQASTFDVSEYERLGEAAQLEIPKIIRNLQSKVKKKERSTT